jgi:hypothetical protein
MDTAAYGQLILLPDLVNDLTHTRACTHPHIKQLIAVGQSGLTEGNAIQLCLLAASCWSLLIYSLTLKMEAVHSSKTSVDFYWTIRHYVPEDSTLPRFHLPPTSCQLLAWFTLSPWRQFVPLKCHITSNQQYGVTYQNKVLFTCTACCLLLAGFLLNLFSDP